MWPQRANSSRWASVARGPRAGAVGVTRGVNEPKWVSAAQLVQQSAGAGSGSDPGGAQHLLALGESGDDAVVVAHGAADAHEGAPGPLAEGVGGQDGLGQALGVGVLVGRLGGVGGGGASGGRSLGKLLSAVVYPGRADAGKVFAARQRCERVFGGGDKIAALEATRGGQLVF
jgi:hypothetical protein